MVKQFIILFLTEILLKSWNNENQILPDTDTAFLECFEQEVSETKELSEKIDVDIDGQDDLVSMTIEHDRKVPDFPICQWEKCKISLQF